MPQSNTIFCSQSINTSCIAPYKVTPKPSTLPIDHMSYCTTALQGVKWQQWHIYTCWLQCWCTVLVLLICSGGDVFMTFRGQSGLVQVPFWAWR